MDPINILISGDFIPPENDNIGIFSNGLLKTLSEKDLSIINLESPFLAKGIPILKTGLNFSRDPATINSLIKGKFDVITLANNHIRDFGEAGINTTIQVCSSNNIKTIGAGLNLNLSRKPLIIDIGIKKIALLNYCDEEFNIATAVRAGANPFSILNVYYDITSLKGHVDYIFVIYHGGLEYKIFPTPELLNIYKFLIDIGADGVFSHHSHFYGGYVIYNNKPIVYGLGNFLSKTKNKRPTPNWYIGLIAKLKIVSSIEIEVIPIIQNETATHVDLITGNKKNIILQEIEARKTIVNNENELVQYWQNEYKKSSNKILQRILSRNSLEYKIRKRFPIKRTAISNYRLLILLNSIRCSAHRTELINILENIYNLRQNNVESD